MSKLISFRFINLRIIFSTLYFTILIYIVLFARRRYNRINYKTQLNLTPFKEKYSIIQQLNFQTIHIQKDFFIDIVGNILLFVPFFIFINTLFIKEFSNLKIVLIIILSSISIEASQFILNKGVADIDDVILNSIGGITGIFLNKIKQLNKAL